MFTVVNICCLVLRAAIPSSHEHFRAPTALPVLGRAACAYLVGPWTGRTPEQYKIAGVLLALGVVLWGHHLVDQPGDLRPDRPI